MAKGSSKSGSSSNSGGRPSNSVTRSNSVSRPTTSSSKANSAPRANNATPVRAADPVRVASGLVNQRPRQDMTVGTATGDGGRSTTTTRNPTTNPGTPNRPAATKSRHISGLKIQAPKAKQTATPNKQSHVSSAPSPRDEKRVTCKARPDNNKPTKGGGGGGRRFIPWC